MYSQNLPGTHLVADKKSLTNLSAGKFREHIEGKGGSEGWKILYLV